METILQILLNSIVSGLLLSLVAIGFTYIFQVTKVFHLALQIPDSIAANMWMILFGLLLVLIVHFKPKGLFGKYLIQ